MDYIPIILLDEGRLLETILKAERDAAPAGKGRALSPGGPGQPSAGTKTGRPSVGWTWRERRRAEALRIGEGEEPFRSAPGSYGAGDRKAAVERRGASAS